MKILKERYYFLNKESDKLENYEEKRKLYMEMDCLEHLFLGGIETYTEISNFLKNYDYDYVYDIGCAFGHQSEIILENNPGISYIGIEAYGQDFWRKEENKYIVKEYPFKIEAKPKSIAVSVLCLGWNCYFYEKNSSEKQFEQLSKDFNECLLYIPNDFLDFVSKYYTKCKMVSSFGSENSGLYYFSQEE